jgi:hypothetical protein
VKFDLDTLPEDYEVTYQNNAKDDSDSDATNSGETDEIELLPGEYTPDIDMGIHYVGTTEETPYVIGTKFFVDSNHDGKYDESEDVIADAKVELLDKDGHKLYWADEEHTSLTTEVTDYPVETYTDESGEYHFYVPAGSYQVRFYMPESYKGDEYVFGDPKTNSDNDEDVNTANSNGITQVVEVGPGHKTADLTMDAGISCSCDNAPVKSNGGDAFGTMSMFMMMILTFISGIFFVRKEEENQGVSNETSNK